MACRLLPAATAVPLALDKLTLAGERVGLYDMNYESYLRVVVVIGIMVILVCAGSTSLDRTDTARLRAGLEIRRVSAEVERRTHV